MVKKGMMFSFGVLAFACHTSASSTLGFDFDLKKVRHAYMSILECVMTLIW
jgi:hypothetical protein